TSLAGDRARSLGPGNGGPPGPADGTVPVSGGGPRAWRRADVHAGGRDPSPGGPASGGAAGRSRSHQPYGLAVDGGSSAHARDPERGGGAAALPGRRVHVELVGGLR